MAAPRERMTTWMRLRVTVALASVALGATLLSTVAAAATTGPANAYSAPAYVACMQAATGTPDSLERWVASCSAQAQDLQGNDVDVTACVRRGAVSPDAVEHWALSCRPGR
jgi:hypothetical protein